MANSVHLKTLASGVAVITLDLPEKKVNLLSETLMTELNATLDQVLAEHAKGAVRGLVIVSGKDDNFIAGADLEEIRAFQTRSAVEASEKCRQVKEILDKIVKAPFNSVAAINGLCLGGGVELALACKVRVATSNRKTKIALPEVKLGFIPGWGGTVRLPHIVGIQKAIEMVTTGSEVDANKAWRFGLVDEVVSDADLLNRAEEIALGGTPKRSKKALKQAAMDFLLEGNPVGRNVLKSQATKLVKSKSKGYLAPNEAVKVIFKSVENGVNDESMAFESNTAATLVGTQVSRNLINIFFAQQESKKMPENFSPAINIKTVGVLGAGTMGAGIAQAALYAGYNVVLKEVKPRDEKLSPTLYLDKGVETIRGMFDGLVARKKLTQPEADLYMTKLKPTLEYSDMSNCDLVVEAVVENMYVKKSVRYDLEKAIEKPFIFATNTSSLSVGEMSRAFEAQTLSTNEGAAKAPPGIPAARHPGNIVGLHFFNPVHKMPLVEVVSSGETSDETIALAKAFAMKLGKTTVVTADSAGFVVNRILTPYMLETVKLFEQGVPPQDIDKAMKTFGMPMGPLELMDEVGLDICAHVVDTLHGAVGDRLAPPAFLEEIKPKIFSKTKGEEMLGKKSGKGIYLWDAPGGKKVFDKKTKRYAFNPEALAAVKAPKTPKHITEIQNRLVLAMVNEAARCMQEGVVAEPSQLDLAMIFGTGFAPFRGGVLRYADQEGIRTVVQKLTWLAKVAGPNYEPAEILVKMAAEGKTFYRG